MIMQQLARAAVMHHDDKGHNALKNYATFKGLNGILTLTDPEEPRPPLSD